MVSMIEPRRLKHVIYPPMHKSDINKKLLTVPMPPRLILPLRQHSGGKATPTVRAGQTVRKGECLAMATQPGSIPIHAPTSGQVSEIAELEIAHPSSMREQCVVLIPDGKDQWTSRDIIKDYKSIDYEELLHRVASAGIAGMGGGGFPTADKIASLGNTPGVLIVNGVECEPFISADDAAMCNYGPEIVIGSEIIATAIHAKRIIFAIEENKPRAIASIKTALKGTRGELAILPCQYPSGGERQLVQILLNKEVPSGTPTAKTGALCQNIGTVLAVYRAVVHNEPLISRIVTCAGAAITEKANFEVLLGTPISHLLKEAGLKQDPPFRLIVGGPLMGFELHQKNAPITKITNCILATTEKEMPNLESVHECIRCGSCDEVCPANLLPQQLYWYARNKNREKLEQYDLFDCIECGNCSWVCPSNIPLVHYYRAAKSEIIDAAVKKEQADIAATRFDHRLQRVEEEKLALQKRRENTRRQMEEDVLTALQRVKNNERK